MTVLTILSGLLSQEAPTSIDFTVYGVAGTTVTILLYFTRTLWLDNKDLRKENREMSSSAIEKVTAVAVQAGEQLTTSGKTLEAATIMMHSFSGRPSITPEAIFEITQLLRDIRDRGRKE